jgi:hypothetical protein
MAVRRRGTQRDFTDHAHLLLAGGDTDADAGADAVGESGTNSDPVTEAESDTPRFPDARAVTAPPDRTRRSGADP